MQNELMPSERRRSPGQARCERVNAITNAVGLPKTGDHPILQKGPRVGEVVTAP